MATELKYSKHVLIVVKYWPSKHKREIMVAAVSDYRRRPHSFPQPSAGCDYCILAGGTLYLPDILENIRLSE